MSTQDTNSSSCLTNKLHSQDTSSQQTRPTLIITNITTTPGIHQSINTLPTLPRPQHTLRIVFQNCQGLRPTKSDIATNLSSLNQLDTSLVGLAETNLDWNQKKQTTEPILKAIKTLWPHNKTTFVCSNESHNSKSAHQPGGCMQLSISNLAPRHRTNLNDDSGMGRWSSQRFQGKHNHSVQIFTAYRVSQSSPKGLGLRTAYMQQQRAMNNAGIRGISPRTKTVQILLKYC